MGKKKSDIVPGGVPEYIAACPKDVRAALTGVRSAIRQVAPGAVETTSYFQMPGYSHGLDNPYNGMFAWFSYKKPYVRLHVVPPVLKNHQKELANFAKTAAVVSFPSDRKMPLALVKKLVKASLREMKSKSK